MFQNIHITFNNIENNYRLTSVHNNDNTKGILIKIQKSVHVHSFWIFHISKVVDEMFLFKPNLDLLSDTFKNSYKEDVTFEKKAKLWLIIKEPFEIYTSQKLTVTDIIFPENPLFILFNHLVSKSKKRYIKCL